MGARPDSADTETVIDHAAEGTADIGFTEGPRQPVSLRSRVIGHDQLVVVAAVHHRDGQGGRTGRRCVGGHR
jgi:DNA-binding transcriptional LysR family regulator